MTTAATASASKQQQLQQSHRCRTPYLPAAFSKATLWRVVPFLSVGRTSSPTSKKRDSADIRVVEPCRGDAKVVGAPWSADAVGNLYVFKGSSVPALLEVYTSPSYDDYKRMQRWLGLWFSTSEGADTITPPMVPIVFRVASDSTAENDPDPLARLDYTKRRNAYQRQWALEAANSLVAGTEPPPGCASGSSCLVINGEFIPLRELEKMDMSPYPKSRYSIPQFSCIRRAHESP